MDEDRRVLSAGEERKISLSVDSGGLNQKDLRDIISETAPGIGYKSSSFWLNNMGYLDVLTIDRHIVDK